jgi:hypothetical protein
MRSSRKAISATAIWIRTAFSLVPRKRRILRVCLEEQLDRPAALIEIGDFLGGGVEVVAEDGQHLAGVELDAHFAHRILKRVGDCWTGATADGRCDPTGW